MGRTLLVGHSVFILFLIAGSSLLAPIESLAARKTIVTYQDGQIDYFAVLGLKAADLPNPQQVITAYRSELRRQHPDSNGGKVANTTFDAQLLTDAKDVLSDPTLKSQYLEIYNTEKLRRNKNGPGTQANEWMKSSAFNESQVGQVFQNGDARAFVVGIGLNQSHLERTVEYFRTHPQNNFAVKAALLLLDGAPAVIELIPNWLAGRTDPKWLHWNTSQVGHWAEIEGEFKRIVELAPSINRNNRPEYSEAAGFLFWWFAQPESIVRQNLIVEILAKLPADSLVQRLFVQASVSDSSWRTRQWIQELMSHPQAYFALAPAMGTPELVTETDLIETVKNLPEFATHSHLLWNAILPSPESARHPEWFSPYLEDLTYAGLFLQSAIHQPHWRQLHPELITRALTTLGVRRSGREKIMTELMVKPDSMLHPEWLEILIKTDRDDTLTLPLNRVLAIDHVYNDPYLRKILGGSAPTVEKLRRARWLRLDEVPQLAEQMRNDRASLLQKLRQNLLQEPLLPTLEPKAELGTCRSVFNR